MRALDALIINTCMTFTQDQLERILRLREQGLPWKLIADRLGSTPGSLQVMVHRYKNGKWKDANAKLDASRAKLEQMVAAGKSPTQIARELGVSLPTISKSLARMGLDKEMRAELQQDTKRAA